MVTPGRENSFEIASSSVSLDRCNERAFSRFARDIFIIVFERVKNEEFVRVFSRENIYQNGICALFFLLFFFIGRLLLRGKDEDTKKERRKQSGFVFVVVFFGRERGAMREQHQ